MFPSYEFIILGLIEILLEVVDVVLAFDCVIDHRSYYVRSVVDLLFYFVWTFIYMKKRFHCIVLCGGDWDRLYQQQITYAKFDQPACFIYFFVLISTLLFNSFFC